MVESFSEIEKIISNLDKIECVNNCEDCKNFYKSISCPQLLRLKLSSNYDELKRLLSEAVQINFN